VAGGIYLVIIFFFGLAGGIIGRAKGSSFFIWFLIAAIVPVIGVVAAVLYRVEDNEPRQRCPGCGRICMAYDAICTGCSTELEFSDDTELLPPVSQSR
jgi:hypothetical protein